MQKALTVLMVLCGFFFSSGDFAKYDGEGESYSVYDDRGNFTGRVRRNHINGDLYYFDDKGRVRGRVHWNPITNQHTVTGTE